MMRTRRTTHLKDGSVVRETRTTYPNTGYDVIQVDGAPVNVYGIQHRGGKVNTVTLGDVDTCSCSARNCRHIEIVKAVR